MFIIKLKMFLLKFKYPKAGFYTRLVLANYFSMSEIDEWVRSEVADIEPMSIHELREKTCEVEVSYWEE